MSRPEGTRAPDLYYDEKEAQKYNSSSRIINIQAEIAQRAIELLALPPSRPSYILDIGCGSGLSGQELEEAGHYWVGCDISRDMLNVAAERESETGDFIQHDMGLGLPYRPGTFDGVVSISAIQWLCYSDANNQDPKLRLNRFFSSLYTVLKRDAKAILQFYPENSEQAVLIAQSASRVGFSGGLLVDYPNSSKAKKFYLCLSFERSYKVPKALGGSGAGVEMVGRATASSRERERKGSSKWKNPKDKEWVQKKKTRMRAQGKTVKTDSKFTGRKRSSGF
jgi:18S rRNA (guanine1575-N7)-methyltransferase